MRTRHLRGAKPSVHLVHEDRTTANNAVIMGDSRCLPNTLNSYDFCFLTGRPIALCSDGQGVVNGGEHFYCQTIAATSIKGRVRFPPRESHVHIGTFV
jgi:hypothetical protein